MAKYNRYDPRNKKKDRNKARSMNKDLRIKLNEKSLGERFNAAAEKQVIHYSQDVVEDA